MTSHDKPRWTLPARTARTALLLIALATVGGCASSQVRPTDPDSAAMQGFKAVDDMYVVDCLLPGEVRQMGKMTYLSPRIPIKTTAHDCRIRGGEYVLYSRADYHSALGVWKAQADKGDAKAQVIVGEIYERGLGTAPDYAKAIQWYRLAAEQGNARAQRHLGYMYEQGLGVQANMLTALAWYRKSAGGEADALILASAAKQKLDALRSRLQGELQATGAETEALRRQVDALQRQLRQERNKPQPTADVDALRALLARTRADLQQQTNQLEEKTARLVALKDTEVKAVFRGGPPMGPSQWHGMPFGHYYALIIALEDYTFWNDLSTPKADAKAIAAVLANKYGFNTRTLIDADAYDILAALNDLREDAGKDDNVLIYFAGHGQIRSPFKDQRTGYWLPVNAQKDRTTFWLPNSQINEQLAMLDARSVLVVADSCYAGALSTDPASLLLGGQLPLSKKLVELALQRRARYVLSSGGLHPVLDRGSGQHSVFAGAFIKLLRGNHELITGRGILQGVQAQVAQRAAALGFEQHPELRPIRAAGHDPGGRFFLVPVTAGVAAR